jgi:hypothetical protein
MKRFPIDIPEDAIREICRRYYVTELALFGSVLGPEFRPESDIDVLVEFEPDAPIGFLGYAGLQEELSELLGRQVDLVSKVGLKPRIRKPVLDSAEVIYER